MLPRSGTEHTGQQNEQDPCPVCFEDLRRTERSYFPCGHSVCSDCNGTLVQRGFLSCPTCRTPMAGVSQRDVETANQQRVVENIQIEGAESSESGNGVQLQISRGGQRYNILFFPDQSTDHPFRVLRSQEHNQQAHHVNVPRVQRRVRTNRSAAPYYTSRTRSGASVLATSRINLTNQTNHINQPNLPNQEDELEEESGGVEVRANAPLALDPSMENLLHGLLVPISVSDFLARRRRV